MLLTAVEFEVKEPLSIVYEPGEKYVYFKDLETGKFYQPKAGVKVLLEDSEVIPVYEIDGEEIIELWLL